MSPNVIELQKRIDDLVAGHPKCTTFGHLKVHHFMGVKTVSD